MPPNPPDTPTPRRRPKLQPKQPGSDERTADFLAEYPDTPTPEAKQERCCTCELVWGDDPRCPVHTQPEPKQVCGTALVKKTQRGGALKGKPPEERFWALVDKRADDECWEWQGTRINDYGALWFNGRNWRAHRVAYELIVGPIPEGLVLDHLCRNKGCVNPAHLEPVTGTENMLRGESLAAKRARQTHCKRGHPLTSDNVYVQPSRPNSRNCRKCAQIKDFKRRGLVPLEWRPENLETWIFTGSSRGRIDHAVPKGANRTLCGLTLSPSATSTAELYRADAPHACERCNRTVEVAS